MSVYETILKRRTIRKYQQKPITREQLEKMINAARLAPSGANMQPLKYVLVNQKELVEEVFKYVKWAAYIAPEGDPAEGEEPVAYIGVLVDTKIKGAGYELDAGAACQNIMLTAEEMGISSCWMGAINRKAIMEALNIPEDYILNTVIALGYPLEESITEELGESIRYYKDEQGRLHVPKRKLEDIIIN